MKTLNDYLNDLKEKCGSDYKAAKMLGVTNVTVCKIRTRQQLSDDLALKIAEILEIDPSEILLAATIARSDGKVKIAWEKISQMSGRTTAVFWIAGSAAPALLTALKGGAVTAWCILC